MIEVLEILPGDRAIIFTKGLRRIVIEPGGDLLDASGDATLSLLEELEMPEEDRCWILWWAGDPAIKRGAKAFDDIVAVQEFIRERFPGAHIHYPDAEGNGAFWKGLAEFFRCDLDMQGDIPTTACPAMGQFSQTNRAIAERMMRRYAEKE